MTTIQSAMNGAGELAHATVSRLDGLALHSQPGPPEEELCVCREQVEHLLAVTSSAGAGACRGWGSLHREAVRRVMVRLGDAAAPRCCAAGRLRPGSTSHFCALPTPHASNTVATASVRCGDAPHKRVHACRAAGKCNVTFRRDD